MLNKNYILPPRRKDAEIKGFLFSVERTENKKKRIIKIIISKISYTYIRELSF